MTFTEKTEHPKTSQIKGLSQIEAYFYKGLNFSYNNVFVDFPFYNNTIMKVNMILSIHSLEQCSSRKRVEQQNVNFDFMTLLLRNKLRYIIKLH